MLVVVLLLWSSLTLLLFIVVDVVVAAKGSEAPLTQTKGHESLQTDSLTNNNYYERLYGKPA